MGAKHRGEVGRKARARGAVGFQRSKAVALAFDRAGDARGRRLTKRESTRGAVEGSATETEWSIGASIIPPRVACAGTRAALVSVSPCFRCGQVM